VAGFLTDEWFREAAAAAGDARVDDDLRIVIQQVVTDGPHGEDLPYVVTVGDGTLSVQRGWADVADVTFTQDRRTAEAIHRGELSAQTAFIEGRLRLGGDLRALIDRAGALATIDDVLGAARA
jgi:alkyl sulfatase BDS1-like metallo-beta-lactamase superfamily hydrolase